MENLIKQQLIDEIKKCESRLADLRVQFNSLPLTFDDWVEHVEKVDYPYISMNRSPEANIIEEFLDKEFYMEKYRTYNLDDILDVLIGDEFCVDSEYRSYNGETSEYEPNEKAEEVKKALQKINFGSVTFDW